MKGLAGDSSDNIKGVPGIGQKVAISLLNKYKDLDTIYENIDQIPDLEIRGASRVQSLLNQYKENAYQSRMLATINTQAPLNLDIAGSEFWDFEKKEVVENYDIEKSKKINDLKKKLRKLEYEKAKEE